MREEKTECVSTNLKKFCAHDQRNAPATRKAPQQQWIGHTAHSQKNNEWPFCWFYRDSMTCTSPILFFVVLHFHFAMLCFVSGIFVISVFLHMCACVRSCSWNSKTALQPTNCMHAELLLILAKVVEKKFGSEMELRYSRYTRQNLNKTKTQSTHSMCAFDTKSINVRPSIRSS